MPILGPIYQHLISGHDILTYLAFSLVPLTYWALYSTRFGLRLRAVGENPAAVDTAGISVRALALQRGRHLRRAGRAVAGVYLSLAQAAYFQPHMSAGKGFIALAALVFAKWRPWPALATCLLFGFLDAVSIRLQGVVLPGIGQVPVQAIEALPYILTVVLLAGFIGKAIPPQGLGHSLCQRALSRDRGAVRGGEGGADERLRALFAVSASARRCAPRAARSSPAAMSRTPPIRRAPAPRRARSRAMAHGRRAAHRRNPASIGDGEALCTPCGGCRQRIREFADAADAGPCRRPGGVRRTFRLPELLPESFGPGHLPA